MRSMNLPSKRSKGKSSIPEVRLRAFDERNELGRVERPLLVEKALVCFGVTGGCDQVVLDRRLEGTFPVIYWHSAAASCGW